MVQVSERLEGRYEVRDVPFGRICERGSGRVVLECNCRARLVLVGRATARNSEYDHLECGVCGERFVLAQMVARRDYVTAEHREVRGPKEEKFRCSWLEDYLERLPS